EIIEKVLLFNERNPDWGYDRIAGTMKYLGYDVSATTIRKILNDHGIIPDPERRKRGDWQQFIETQQYVTAATDFATVERVTEHELVREHLLFFMDIESREVRLGGIAHNPDSNWTTQIARNMCDMWDGFLLGKKYLIHDRDTLFNRRFDSIFESIGVTIKRLPPFCPMMNSRCENFIRALKTECLDKIIFSTREQIRLAVNEFLEYWNRYRPTSALDGKMIKPYPQDDDGEIQEISFLGGLLHGYRRVKQAA
ncbi:MAG: integrase core domain-containing protein, partial [Victivallaceae bacterium]|nr:integrase core domain-containing protein [Victivallaceae bacterium]